MDKLLLLGGEVIALAAALLASYVTLLFYRAPNHAKWLEGDAATTTVMIGLMAAVIFSIAFLIQGGAAILPNAIAAVAMAVAVFAVLVWTLWKLLGMRTRLEAAAAGRSPFQLSVSRPPASKRRRRRAPRAA